MLNFRLGIISLICINILCPNKSPIHYISFVGKLNKCLLLKSTFVILIIDLANEYAEIHNSAKRESLRRQRGKYDM